MVLKSIFGKIMIVLALIAILLPINANAVIKPGSLCSKKGLVQIYGGKKFTCILKNRKLVWNAGVQITAPTPKPTATATSTPTPSPSNSVSPAPTSSATPSPSASASSLPTPTAAPISYEPPSEPSDNIELCKMIEASQRRGFTWAGFPRLEPLTTKTGTVKWAVIPIDFEDLPGEKDFRSRVDEQMKLVSEWFAIASDGKFKVEWVVAKDWIRLPGVSSDYPVAKTTGVNNTPGGVKLFKTAMAAADPQFDFTNVQTVNFLLPLNQNIANEGEQGFPWDQHVKDVVTNEGKISSFTIPGKYQTWPDHPFWSYWIHEFGHAIGLPHVGGNSGPLPPFNPWEIMGGQDGPAKELSGWVRFLSGWMGDERVYCKDASKVNKVEVTLVPLSNSDSGVKLAMFPISSTKALMIESRRVTKFSCTTPTPRNGVLVYLMDLTLGHGQDFLVPISPAGRGSEERATCNGTLSVSSPNPLLGAGDKVTYGGLTVEILNHSNFDRVVVTR